MSLKRYHGKRKIVQTQSSYGGLDLQQGIRNLYFVLRGIFNMLLAG